MKKKLYLAFVLLLALVCLVCSCDGTSDTTTGTESPKNEDHIHAYTIKNVDDAYLKESTADGVLAYYYSCACGEKGTETFTLSVGGGNNQDSDKEEHVYETTWTADEEKHWRACMDASCSATSDKALHTFGEWIVDTAATCQKTGTRHHVCTVCNKSVSETMPVEPTAHNYATTWTSDGTHHWHMCLNDGCTSVLDKTAHSGDNICSVCLAFYSWGEKTYIRVNANGNKDANGSYILFGEYPQTIKADDVTITSTIDSRGYYLGSDGAYYAKVTAKPYSSGYTFSTGKTVSNGTLYYFKVEPIRWRILSENGDTALILCDSIIAEKRFDDSSNNYANSEIRAWLNAEFYNTAFGSLQRELILITTVDNSVASTGYSLNSYACANTSDKIFLLSYKEVTNTAYGFSSSDYTYDTARRMQTTDYTRATGAYTNMSTSSSYYGNGWWWLRSPYYFYDIGAREVYYDGYVNDFSGVRSSGYGVVPALQIRLSAPEITPLPEEDAYVRVDANDTPDENGSYILFGEYPQSLKADNVTITTTTDSRGYYLGSDGYYYAKVTAKPYDSGYTFSTGKTVSSGTVYYFKVEPIRWRILSENGDTALILCDSIIANHCYDDWNNNYANSEIRAWLNEEFYNTAFDSLQRELILTTTVDNSVASTGYSSNPYACADTNDKMFLLSYEEVTNTAYGFSSSYSTDDTARRMQTSDYTRATGAWMYTSSSYYGNGWWWLRSPHYNYGYGAREVDYDGYVNYYTYVSDSNYGVVPALQIRLR